MAKKKKSLKLLILSILEWALIILAIVCAFIALVWEGVKPGGCPEWFMFVAAVLSLVALTYSAMFQIGFLNKTVLKLYK